MKYVFLTDSFYHDYANCSEIEQKRYRPYIMLVIKIDNSIFALPMRSHIKHAFAFITDIENHCGVDYSKAVVINNEAEYIDSKQPKIRENEFKALMGKEYILKKEFEKYLSDYKKSYKANAKRHTKFYKFSTLQYFHKELELEQ